MTKSVTVAASFHTEQLWIICTSSLMIKCANYSEGTRTCYFQKVKKIKVTPVKKRTIDPDRYRLYEVFSVGPIKIGVVDHLRSENQGSRHSPL